MLYDSLKSKLPFLAVLSLIIITLLGQNFSPIFQYDRSSIMSGEYWRIITCHFVHTGWNHLFLNLTGAILLYSLFFRLYSPLYWLIGAAFSVITISFSFLFFSPALDWYMGLSGLLHSLLAMGIIGEISRGKKFYLIGLLALAGKLVMEYVAGPSTHTSQFINADIISNAHLSGAIAGIITACCVIIYIKGIVPTQSLKLTDGPAG